MIAARYRFSLRMILFVVIILFSLILSGCQGAKAPQELEKMNIMLDWAPNALQVPIIAGIEEGFFKEAGIDLILHYPGDTEDAVRTTAIGKMDVGLSMSGEFIPAVAGADHPIVGIAEFQPILPLGLTVLSSETTFEDFKGQTFGIWSMPDSNICFDLLLESAGLTRDDVNVLDPGFDVVPPLLAGQVLGISSSPLYEQADCKRLSDKECSIFLYTDYGCGAQSAIIITNRDWLKNHEDQAKRFLGALLKSLKFSLENEDKAMQHWYDRYPEFDAARELEQWRMVQTTFVRPYTKEHGLGWWNMDNMKFWAKVFYEYGYVDELVDPADFITNKYLPEEKLIPTNIDELLTAQDKLLGH